MDSPTVEPVDGPGDAPSLPGSRRFATFKLEAEERPQPRLGVAIAGISGALIAVGFAGIGLEWMDSDNPSGVLGALLMGLVAVGALLVLHLYPRCFPSAGTGAVVVAAPLFWLFAMFGAGEGDLTKVKVTVALIALTVLAMFMVGPARGRTVLLAVGLLAIVAFANLFVVPDGSTEAFDMGRSMGAQAGYSSDSSSDFNAPMDDYDANHTDDMDDYDAMPPSEDGSMFDDHGDYPASGSEDLGHAYWIVNLLFGAGLVMVLIRLDRAGAYRVGTAVVYPMLGALSSAVTGLGTSVGIIPGALAALVIALVVGAVGSRGTRRFTTWLAAATVLASTVVIAVDALGSDHSPGVYGGMFAGLGAALVGVAFAVRRYLHEDEGVTDDMSTTPSSPPFFEV